MARVLSGRPLGRRKKIRRVRIAIEVDCNEEYCKTCRMLKQEGIVLFCDFFKKELCPALESNIAERCPDCHIAERCAKGEDIH